MVFPSLMAEYEVANANILLIAETYAQATGKSLSAVSKEFYGNGDFFEQLRNDGRSITVRQMLGPMLQKFRDNWPPKTPWPPTRPIRMGRRPQINR